MKKVFIDTNIPMYCGGKESVYKKKCGEILERAIKGEFIGVTDVEVFQEILYRFMHINEIKKGWKIFDNFKETILEVLPVVKEDIYLARDLSERYRRVRPRDLIHAAIMINNRIKQIYSTDKDLDKIEEIERIDPLAT